MKVSNNTHTSSSTWQKVPWCEKTIFLKKKRVKKTHEIRTLEGDLLKRHRKIKYCSCYLFDWFTFLLGCFRGLKSGFHSVRVTVFLPTVLHKKIVGFSKEPLPGSWRDYASPCCHKSENFWFRLAKNRKNLRTPIHLNSYSGNKRDHQSYDESNFKPYFAENWFIKRYILKAYVILRSKKKLKNVDSLKSHVILFLSGKQNVQAMYFFFPWKNKTLKIFVCRKNCSWNNLPMNWLKTSNHWGQIYCRPLGSKVDISNQHGVDGGHLFLLIKPRLGIIVRLEIYGHTTANSCQ